MISTAKPISTDGGSGRGSFNGLDGNVAQELLFSDIELMLVHIGDEDKKTGYRKCHLMLKTLWPYFLEYKGRWSDLGKQQFKSFMTEFRAAWYDKTYCMTDLPLKIHEGIHVVEQAEKYGCVAEMGEGNYERTHGLIKENHKRYGNKGKDYKGKAIGMFNELKDTTHDMNKFIHDNCFKKRKKE
jgi:hypothetical protein